MTIPILRRVAMAAALLTTAAVLPGLPAYAAGTGTIAGTVTTSSGTAAPDVSVQVYLEDNDGNIGWAGWSTTDAQGRYTVGSLSPGSYLVAFDPQDGPEQFYQQKSELWDADRLTVSDGATTTANDQLMATGVITGQIRNAAGDPVTDLLVSAREVEQSHQAWGVTDAEGRYRIAAFPGTYTVSFEPIADSYQTQYVPGQLDEWSAHHFTVAAGGEIVANDSVLPIGSLSGRFTTETGAAASGVGTTVSTLNWGVGAHATTDVNGEFSVPAILAGSYRVTFEQGERRQYYQGKLEFHEATTVNVVGGQQTRITDSWLPTGSVRVTAVDAVSGSVIPSFCVEDVCSNGTGHATVTGLPQGTHYLHVSADDQIHFNTGYEGVPAEVKGGTTVDLTVRLRPGAAITTTVTDRITGAGVADVCLNAFLPKQVRLADGYGYCSDSTGRITIGPLEPGMYRLFADPQSDIYGRQWVGATGGTGDERQAALVATQAGRIATGPSVKLDKAGTIVGQVTDATTGQPILNASIGLFTAHPGSGRRDQLTDAQGNYQMSRLGPYEWPLIFGRQGYAPHWSGGTGSRYAATTVKVTAGGTAIHNTALTKGTQVTGTVTSQSGTNADGNFVIAHNADTGDVTGGDWIDNGVFNMSVVPGQSAYFTYNARFGEGQYYQGQYPLPPTTRGRPGGPALATPGIAVPAVGSLTVDIVVNTN
ncbi:carboxypeptidase-like regulatory domain-containing protein [Micromonospora sp. CPCC 206060]|uniref:carboxypeptidase-like regulatory domain-containing protein n=1 Tax=Micromonospora sp. CPCC 206060 TaxID=3122406 RepID=UPI002FF370CC